VQWVLPLWTRRSFHSHVLGIREESPSTYTVLIRPNRRWSGFQSGQYVQIQVEKNGVRYKRIFSISSSPDLYKEQGLIELTVRVKQGGKITPWMKSHFQNGGYLLLSKAMGDFLETSKNNEELLFIAGGSGITPFRSFLKSSHFYNKNVTLLYYCHSEDEHLFAEELKKINSSSIRVHLIATANAGRFCWAQALLKCPDILKKEIYLCGPPAMIRHCRQELSDNGIGSNSIHVEYFGPEVTPVPQNTENLGGTITFSRSGKRKEMKRGEARNLLEFAEDSGLSPQYGCRIGICHQCKCRKKSGVVFNTKSGRYSQSGEEDVQLCQTIPSGDVVLDI